MTERKIKTGAGVYREAEISLPRRRLKGECFCRWEAS